MVQKLGQVPSRKLRSPWVKLVQVPPRQVRSYIITCGGQVRSGQLRSYQARLGQRYY